MESPPFDVEKRSKDRIDLNRKVQLRFDKFQEFLSEIAGNISPGGMFVRSDDPHPPGEQFDFECSLADGYPLVSGRAEVVWVRKSPTATESRGMGVRFISLHDKSEELIRRIVAERIQAGEQTFDLETADSTAELEWLPAAPDVTGEILTAAEGLVEEKVLEVGDSAQEDEGLDESVADDLIFAQAADLELIEDPDLAAEPVSASDSRSRPPEDSRPQEPSPAPRDSSPVRPRERPPVEVPKAIRDLSQSRPTEPAPAAPVVPVRSQPPPPVEPVASTAPRPRRKRIGFGRLVELVVISVLAGACMVLVFNQYWVRPRIEGLEAKLEELTGSSRIGGPPGIERAAVAKDAVSAADEGASVDEGSEVTPPAVTVLELDADRPSTELARRAVSSWAKAWSEQRVEDYLSFYSADFVPASGISRAAWEQRRRDRLLVQGDIRVAVVSLDLKEVSPLEVLVSFTQSYRSNVFRDRVRKTLRMVWEDDDWKIVEEIVIRQLPW